MSQLSSSDQQVWRKVMQSKSKFMNLQQIEACFPSFNKKTVMNSVMNLVKMRLFSTSKSKDDDKTTLFHAHQADEAKQKATLTNEQNIVLQVIGQAGNRGIASSQIGRQIGSDLMPQAILRKTVRGLESAGHIKQFKPVNAPTTVYYLLSHLKPPEEISGGIWFDDNKEYDQGLVDTICTVLLRRVQELSYVKEDKRSEHDRALVPHAINTSSKANVALTPHALRSYINKLSVTSAQLSVKNVMEIMRALELDGHIEVVKPIGGVEIRDDLLEAPGSDDEGPSASKRKRTNGGGADSDEDLDDEEKERRKELKVQKEREKIREKKRRERMKEKEREKEKKRKEKEKKKKKEKEREKEKEKKRRKKEKEKEKANKKKRRKGDDDSGSDSDRLVALGDSDPKKKKKRRRDSISSVSSISSSDSDSDSDSDTDSDSSSSSSGSESDSSISSVSSSQIDLANIALKPSRSSLPTTMFTGLTGGLTDLSDTAIIYRATNRLAVPLGQTQAPCGKCPVFQFCQEGGPVEPDGCEYYSSWLGDAIGGWDAEASKIMRPELHQPDPPVVVEGEGEEWIGAEGAEGMEGMEGGEGEGEYDELYNAVNDDVDKEEW